MCRSVSLAVLTFVVLSLCGCGGNSQIEQLQLEIESLKSSMASAEKLELIEKSIQEGDQKCIALMNNSIGEINLKQKQVEAVSQSASVKAESAIQNSNIAIEQSKQTKADFGEFRTTIETLYEGQKATLTKIEAGFQTRLAGAEQNFKNDVTLLETQLRGKEAELSTLVDKKLQGMENSVATFRTELTGKLAEEREHTEKIRTENAGYKATLLDALKQMETLEAGFRKHLEDEVGKMTQQYNQNQKEFQALKTRVDAYGKQLARVRLLIVSILAEFDEAAVD